MRFRFYHNDAQEVVSTPKEYTKMWVGTFPFNPDFDEVNMIIYNFLRSEATLSNKKYITKICKNK